MVSGDRRARGRTVENGPAPASATRHVTRHHRVLHRAWQIIDALLCVIVFLALALVIVVI